MYLKVLSSSLRMFYKYFRKIFWLKMLGKTTFILVLCPLYLLVSHTHIQERPDRWALLFVLRPGIQASRHPVPPSSSSPNTQVGWPTSHLHPGVLNIHACPDMDSVMNRIICLHNFPRVPHVQFGPSYFGVSSATF